MTARHLSRRGSELTLYRRQPASPPPSNATFPPGLCSVNCSRICAAVTTRRPKQSGLRTLASTTVFRLPTSGTGGPRRCARLRDQARSRPPAAVGGSHRRAPMTRITCWDTQSAWKVCMRELLATHPDRAYRHPDAGSRRADALTFASGGPSGLPYFLKRRSKALRASSGLRGVSTAGVTGSGGAATPSRATVTRGENKVHSLALSFTGMRTGIGLRH